MEGFAITSRRAILALLCINGRVAQLVRALSSHDRGQRFESFRAHHPSFPHILEIKNEGGPELRETREDRTLVFLTQTMNEEPKDDVVAEIVPEQVPPPEQEPAPSFLSRVGTFVGELFHVILISLAIIVPVRYFLIQPFYVKGASMEPNFLDHQYLIIDEISYRFADPARGNIVVFRYPNDPSQYFIKRVIGLPGERVKVSGGKITLFNAEHPDGFVLDETSYLGSLITTGEKDLKLGPDEYFLLGDNRPASLDSRIFGAVPHAFIVGRVWFRGWPPEKLKVFTAQSELQGEEREQHAK